MLKKIFPQWHARRERQKQLKVMALAFYTALSQQARQPFFYTEFKVPDTFEGRLEMLSIHLFLVLHTLKPYDDADKTLSQAITNTTFLMLDEGLRHYGYSDLSLGRRLKKAGGRVYARLNYLESALNESEKELENLIEEAIYHNEKDKKLAKQMTNYILKQIEHLRSLPKKEFINAQISFKK